MNSGRDHLLVTRFSLALSSRHLDEDWLRERVELFERFTLPSVRGQSETRFRWLLLLSPETPRWVWDRAMEWHPAESYPANTFRDIAVVVNQVATTETVICSRLDSDDAISPHFIKNIQEAAGDEREWLVYPNGVVWSRTRCVGWNGYLHNPFVSFVEQARPFKGPFCVEHTEVATVAPVRPVSSERGWLINVHGRNVANSENLLDQGQDLDRVAMAAEFGLNFNSEELSTSP